MLNLVFKDILVQKKSLLFYFIYIIIAGMAFKGIGLGGFTAAVMMLSYVFLANSCTYDDKNKAHFMLNSLPVKRSKIVLSKYVSMLLFFFLSILMYLSIYHLVKLISLPMSLNLNLSSINIEGLLGTFFALSLFAGIYLPIFFKFGDTKSRTISIVLYLVVFFGFALVVQSLNSIKQLSFFQNIYEAIKPFTKNDMIIGTSIALISILILTLSYFVSIKFYKNREF
ncbi:ABC-2 family transporter protein [Gottschalkia purinilytica]|uniref:ABC-2 family transporter protein n=1 Tax=Gottschalkia purinilytica TaxID=1503 RepID=A0A0L0WAZ5_GOTPU|nr:ABC-2 transporter permease [Gottschalkia purinilytica]KNF08668.1 ABC-2 family transporter protein [Gottschalkia purinilytica]